MAGKWTTEVDNAVVRKVELTGGPDFRNLRLSLEFTLADKAVQHLFIDLEQSKRGEFSPNWLAHAGDTLYGLFEICGVQSWDRLVGRPVRLRIRSKSMIEFTISIGHYLNERWMIRKPDGSTVVVSDPSEGDKE